MTSTTATINVSSEPQQATLAIGDFRRFDVLDDDYYDLSVTLNSIESSKANLTVKSIHEEVTAETIAEEEEKEKGAEGEEEIEESYLTWLWVLIGVVVVSVLIGIGYGVKKKRE